MDTTRELTADVLVVGSGTAGSLAALAAADEGADVLMLERDFASGGTGTRGGIHAYYHGSHGGFQETIDAEIKELEKRFGVRGGSFHPEAKRVSLARHLEERGVRVLYHTIACGVEMEGSTIRAVRAADGDGLLRIRARVVVDATGDGDVAAAAGASFTFGRAFDGASHQYSFVPRRMLKRTPAAKWEVSFDNYDAGWVDPTDPWDVSRALIDGRRHMLDYFEDPEDPELPRQILGISTHLGVREGRHVVGEHVISFMDFLCGRTHDDVICTAHSHYDSHARDMANDAWFPQAWHVVMVMYRRGIGCHIPFRSVLVRGVDNLLMGCRALSVDREASLAIRMQRDMQKLGEAVGVAAGRAARSGTALRDLDIRALQQRLVERGLLEPDEWKRPCLHSFTFTRGALAEQPWNALALAAAPLAHGDLIEPLTAYVGTEEEGRALWWLYLLRENGHGLLHRLVDDEQAPYAKRRGAAFALTLMDDSRAVPMLLECLRRRDDECPPPSIKTFPRWVAALVCLRHLQSPAAIDEVTALLGEQLEDRFYTFALAYLHDVVPALTTAQTFRLHHTLDSLDRRPDMGFRYDGQGARSKDLDIRWNILLWACRLRLALGGDIAEAAGADRYADDPRPFVRTIWQRFLTQAPRPARHLQTV